MNKLLCGVATAVLIAAGSVAAQDTGAPYVKFGVGYGGPGEQDVDNVLGLAGADGINEGEFNLRPLLGIGYDFANPWRLEVDLVQRYNQLGAVEGTANGLDSDINSISLMANVIRDFDLNLIDRIDVDPYLGAGLGFAQTRFAVSGPGNGIQHKELGGAAQLLAGLDFDVTPRWSADLGYRYWVTADNDINIGGVSQDLKTPHSHDVFFALRYSFGAAPVAQQANNQPAPPPLAPATAAEPVVICDDVEFVVYFGWDSSDLTAQARQVISNAADQAAECDITRVRIEGHTDRSGSASYNQQLSQRRANVVRTALIDEGVAASVITVSSKGEGDTAKPTEDGVREPLNRRSEVLISVANPA